PTILLVQGQGLGANKAALARLEADLGKEPGVAGVLGPREQIPPIPPAVFLAADGNAARYAVIFDDSPLGAPAIHEYRRLDDDLPRLLRRAGLGNAESGLTGQTALASQTVEAVIGSSLRV